MDNDNTPETVTFSASTIKSYVSLLFGVAIKQGIITNDDLNNLEKPVSYYMPEFSDTILDKVTLDDLLSGSSGLPSDDFLLDDAPGYYNELLQNIYSLTGVYPPVLITSLLSMTSESLQISSELLQIGSDPMTNVAKLLLFDGSGQPIYTNRLQGLTKSSNTKVFVPENGKPADIAPCYSTVAFNIAGLILHKLVCESANITFGSAEGMSYFNNWRINNLDSKIDYTGLPSNMIISNFQNKFVLAGGIGYCTNNFIKNMALLIINNGYVNGEQILDETYINEINSNNIEKYRRFGTGKYYFRGIWLSGNFDSITNAPLTTPVKSISGLGGLRVSWNNERLVSVFRRNSGGLNSSNYNFKPDIVNPVVDTATILLLFNTIGKYGTSIFAPDANGTFYTLDSKEAWNNYWENITSQYTKDGNYTLEETKLLKIFPEPPYKLYDLEKIPGYDLIKNIQDTEYV